MAVYKVILEMRVKTPDFTTGSKENQRAVRAQMIHGELLKVIVKHFKNEGQIAMKVTEEK